MGRRLFSIKSAVIFLSCIAVLKCVSGQSESNPIPEDPLDYDALFEIALNISGTSSTTPTPTEAPTTIAQLTAPECAAPNICVPYYLCGDRKPKDETLNLDDPTNPCHYLLTCCPLEEIHEDRITEAPPTSANTPTQSPPVVTVPTVTDRPTTFTPVNTPSTDTRVTIAQCGKRNKEGVSYKISNSHDHESEFGEFPWMVALMKDTELFGLNTSVYACGGSLIHPKVVLTAAHCVNKKPSLTARAGEWDTQTEAEAIESQDRRVTEIIVHENYYKGGYFNDIALLIVDTPFDLSKENVRPICLAKKNSRFDSITCTASGWGAHTQGGVEQTILKKVDLPIVPRDRCQEQFRVLRNQSSYELHESYLCAGGKVGKDTCKGDGGSPLVCPTSIAEDLYVQTGVVSWGRGCGTENLPGVYANIAILRDWIDQKMREKNLDTIYYEY